MTDLVASSEEMSCLWNLSTEETEAEGRSVKGQPKLHNKFQCSSHGYTRRPYHIKQMTPPLQPPFSTSSASQKILSKYRHFRAFLLTAPVSGNTWNKIYIESQKSFFQGQPKMTEIETNSWSVTNNMMLINRNASLWKDTVECYQRRSLESLSHSPSHHMLSLMPVPDLQLRALVTMYFRGTEKIKLWNLIKQAT